MFQRKKLFLVPAIIAVSAGVYFNLSPTSTETEFSETQESIAPTVVKAKQLKVEKLTEKPVSVAVEEAITEEQMEGSEPVRKRDPWVKRENIALPEDTLSTLAQRYRQGEEISVINFPGLNGEIITVEVDGVHLMGKNSGTFTGKIEGYPNSDVVLSFVNQAQAGTIEDPSRSLYLSYEAYANNQVIVQELDMQKLQEYATCDSPELHGIDTNHKHHSSSEI